MYDFNYKYLINQTFPFYSLVNEILTHDLTTALQLKYNLRDINYIVYYEKPLLTFERLLETYLSAAPRGMRSFIAAMQVWIKQKLFIKSEFIKLRPIK